MKKTIIYPDENGNIFVIYNRKMEYNNINDFKSNFAKIYHQNVFPSLRAFENDRLKTFKSAILYTVIGLLISIIMIFYGLHSDIEIVLFIGFAGIILSLVIYGCMQKNFENKLKERIMPVLMKAFGNFNWTTSQVIDTLYIRASEIFSGFDDRSVDDNFYGSYRQMPIEISETHLTYTTRDSKGRRQTHTRFKGLLVCIATGKTFSGHTIIRCREFLGNRRVYEEVKLEDVEFGKQFFVDSNDQVEARFLLTTAFMERFKKIRNSFGSKHAECSFKDGKILIALSTAKDLFKLGSINKPLTDTAPFKTFLIEIISILEMIDYLKVTQKTGL